MKNLSNLFHSKVHRLIFEYILESNLGIQSLMINFRARLADTEVCVYTKLFFVRRNTDDNNRVFGSSWWHMLCTVGKSEFETSEKPNFLKIYHHHLQCEILKSSLL